MKFAILLMAAVLAAICPDAWSQTNSLDQVVLLDVQGLWGGTNLWISGTGKAVCRYVRTPAKGESGLQETRHSLELSREQQASLRKLVNEHDFFNIKTVDRYGVPDESRPAIFIKSGDRTHAVGKWANDKHTEFDPIYELLLKIAESGKSTPATYKGPYDSDWTPVGFPSGRDILDRTRPKRDKK